MNYTILNFSTATGTMTVAFEDFVSTSQTVTEHTDGLPDFSATTSTNIVNYNAPRKDGVYLAGDEFEDYIRLVSGEPLTGALTQEELTQMIREMALDDPSTVTGGEDIKAKYAAYLASQGTPEDVIEILINK